MIVCAATDEDAATLVVLVSLWLIVMSAPRVASSAPDVVVLRALALATKVVPLVIELIVVPSANLALLISWPGTSPIVEPTVTLADADVV